MRLMALSLLLCWRLRAQQANVEGVAIDSVTKQPMAGVHITMMPFGAEGLASEQGASGHADRYGAISGRDGHFSIAGRTPALYLLIAQRNGYIYLPAKALNGRADPTVTVKTGDQLTNLTVEMTPHAVMVGHVVDEFGDPVQYVEVRAVPVSPGSAGNFELTPMEAATDDRGQFRIVLPPGKFYVQARANRGMFDQNGEPEIRNDGLGPPTYGITFYPAAASTDRAAVVELAAGQEVAGIDIHLARTRTVTISGIVTGIPANRPAFAAVRLFSAEESPDQPPISRFAPAGPDGSFAIAGLTPGRYRLQARLESSRTGGPLQSAAVEVRPEGVDERGVTLALAPGEAVTGTLAIEGASANSASAEKLTVRLEPASQRGMPSGPARGVEVGEDGTFRVEQVFPERLRVRVVPMPENAYIKSVSVGDAEAPDGVLDFSRGVSGASIKVTLNRNGGQVEGSVVGEDGEPLRASLAFVVLAATADDVDEQNFKLVQAG